MSRDSRPRRGVNWLVVWIGIGLLVAAGLIVGVNLMPVAQPDSLGGSRNAPSPTRSASPVGPASPIGPAAPTQGVTLGGLTIRVPAGYQVVEQPNECSAPPPFDGSSTGYVVVTGFDWGAVSSCPMIPAQPGSTPTPTPPAPPVHLMVMRYRDPVSGYDAIPDITKAGARVATTRAAGQEVDEERETDAQGGGTLIVFTRDKVVVELVGTQPSDPLVARLLSSAS
jgi:hypothetical protein